ncbi:LptA/OstA family protein [Magnetococcales bacterium HHB-1]
MNKSAYAPWRLALWLILPLMLSASPLLAIGKGLVITADSLEMDDKRHIAIFSGHVRVSEGDLRLSAGRMTVHYMAKKNRGQKRDRIREIRADGNVVLHHTDYTGWAQTAIYRINGNVLELIGKRAKKNHKRQNAIIRRGQDRLEGERIKLTLNKQQRIEKVSVKGGGSGGRVSAQITSSGMKTMSGP